MNNMLHTIIRHRKKEFARTKLLHQRFRRALTHSPIAILGEIKLASPTEGVLGKSQDIEARALAYKHASVDILSIVTEPMYFSGNISFIPRVQRACDLPILQKDFVIDPRQIYQSAELGVHALLLIASIVDAATLKQLVSLCQKLGIEPVVEIYDQKDLKKALSTSVLCIAANARNLQTLTIDVDGACKMLKRIPDRYIKLAFSGIHSIEEVRKYADAGARGVLVGTSLMHSSDIKSFIKNIRNI